MAYAYLLQVGAAPHIHDKHVDRIAGRAGITISEYHMVPCRDRIAKSGSCSGGTVRPLESDRIVTRADRRYSSAGEGLVAPEDGDRINWDFHAALCPGLSRPGCDQSENENDDRTHVWICIYRSDRSGKVRIGCISKFVHLTLNVHTCGGNYSRSMRGEMALVQWQACPAPGITCRSGLMNGMPKPRPRRMNNTAIAA